MNVKNIFLSGNIFLKKVHMDEPKRLSSEEKEYMDLRNQYIYLNKLVDNGFKNWCAGNRNGVGQLDLQ
jgi:hypothetical protein